MLDDNVTEITKEVITTEPKNRAWVLSLIINVLLFAACIYLSNEKDKANAEKIIAQRELALERRESSRADKNCTQAIRDAEKTIRLEAKVEIDALRLAYETELKDQARSNRNNQAIINSKVHALEIEAKKIERESNKILHNK